MAQSDHRDVIKHNRVQDGVLSTEQLMSIKGEDGMPSQEDQLEEQGSSMGTGGQWQGGSYQASGTPGGQDRTLTGPSQEDAHRTDRYKTEKDGVLETRIEKKIMVSGEDLEDIDHDAALAAAIRSVADVDPDMSVENIEIRTVTETE